jgi:hypothetical protein
MSTPNTIWTPLVDARTGQEIPQDQEELIFTHLYGSVERGRQLHLELKRQAESGEIPVVGVRILLKCEGGILMFLRYDRPSHDQAIPPPSIV